MRTRWIVGLIGIAWPLVTLGQADAVPSCEKSPQPLAFWLGHWDVLVDGKLGGRNYVERALDGCAVIEHWDDVSGSKGLSLFYFEPRTAQWKQVWVTDHALAPGGLKEKAMIFAAPDRVRFQGTIWVKPDRIVLDRTTLRKLNEDEVSQIIEHSVDGGSSWTTSFDAIYRRAKNPH
jgi:hypothetical protein